MFTLETPIIGAEETALTGKRKLTQKRSPCRVKKGHARSPSPLRPGDSNARAAVAAVPITTPYFGTIFATLRFWGSLYTCLLEWQQASEMDALFLHALPGARVSRLCSPGAYRALARCSEQPTKQVTLALLRREPGAQSERVTDLGQTLTQRQGRWLSITPGHCGVALLAAFSYRQTIKSEVQEGTGEGTLEARPGSHLPFFGELGLPELARVPGRSTNNGGPWARSHDPWAQVPGPRISCCVALGELRSIPGLRVLCKMAVRLNF